MYSETEFETSQLSVCVFQANCQSRGDSGFRQTNHDPIIMYNLRVQVHAKSKWYAPLKSTEVELRWTLKDRDAIGTHEKKILSEINFWFGTKSSQNTLLCIFGYWNLNTTGCIWPFFIFLFGILGDAELLLRSWRNPLWQFFCSSRRICILHCSPHFRGSSGVKSWSCSLLAEHASTGPDFQEII